MLLPEGAPIAPDGYDVGKHSGLRGWYSIQVSLHFSLTNLSGLTTSYSLRTIFVAKGGLLVSVFSPPSREQAKAHGVRAMFFVVRPNRAELIQIGNLID